MPTTLKPATDGVMFDELDDGQLVVVLSSDQDYDIGKIAQRHGDWLVMVGEPESETYMEPDEHELTFRVLADGELIAVTDNG